MGPAALAQLREDEATRILMDEMAQAVGVDLEQVECGATWPPLEAAILPTQLLPGTSCSEQGSSLGASSPAPGCVNVVANALEVDGTGKPSALAAPGDGLAAGEAES